MIFQIFLLITFIQLICSEEYITEKVMDRVPPIFFNTELESRNPSGNWPPKTDEGELPPFKYPFAMSSKKVYDGGWERRVSVDDLPISTKMSGVQMRLLKGAIRELHWHIETEWAYVIYGNARITAVDQLGRSFVEDVEEGDLWLFPAGHAHSIHGTGDDGCFFLLVFDAGNFSPDRTFNLLDWTNHIPRSVLAKNFLVPESVFDNMPPHKLFIFPDGLPGPLNEEKRQTSLVTGEIPESYAFFTNRMRPNVTRAGGYARIIDKNNFPITNIAAAIVTLKPGALRELHWHPNDDEWQYYVVGCARMGVFNHGDARTMDFQAGDVGYVEKSVAHYVENVGDTDLVFLEIFPTPYFEDISLAEWLAHTPTQLVNDHLKTGLKFINYINKTKAVIVP